MKVQELIKTLKTYPKDLEVRIINSAILSGEDCPTFELESIYSYSSILGKDEVAELDFLLLETYNQDYIDPEFLTEDVEDNTI